MKKLYVLLITAFTLLISCSEDNEIETSILIGSWSECYDNPNFITDGSITYTFYKDGTYQLFVYNALLGTDSISNNTYSLQKNILTINYETINDISYTISYNIIKLNEKEMAWQKVGTKYTEGTIGIDYKHFNRDN